MVLNNSPLSRCLIHDDLVRKEESRCSIRKPYQEQMAVEVNEFSQDVRFFFASQTTRAISYRSDQLAAFGVLSGQHRKIFPASEAFRVPHSSAHRWHIGCTSTAPSNLIQERKFNGTTTSNHFARFSTYASDGRADSRSRQRSSTLFPATHRMSCRSGGAGTSSSQRRSIQRAHRSSLTGSGGFR